MRKLPWAILMLAATCGAARLVAACGSDSGGSDLLGPSTDSGAGGDAAISTTSGDTDASVNGNPVCKAVGEACTESAGCCTANCDLTKGTCATALTSCGAPGTTCASPTECCTGSCVNGACSDKQCVADRPTAGACGQNGDCCSGICTNGTCASVNPTQVCRTAGNPCGGNGDCCSNFCNAGTCSSAVSFCAQVNEICASNAACCSGNCMKTGTNVTGVCGQPTAGGGVPAGCMPSGTVCGGSAGGTTGDGGLLPCDQGCCSRSCGYYGALSGFRVCQPPSGCHPTGEVCRADSDCCGWSGAPAPVDGPVHCSKASPTDEYGRCDNGGACREPGSICKPGDGDSCSAENNCCENPSLPNNYCNDNPENCCNKDALGIPRCLIKPINCGAGAPDAGTVCATSADCCGNPCVDNKCGAAGSCVRTGGACTTTADCCTGIACVVAAGAAEGTCGGTTGDGGTSGGTTLPDGGTCGLYGQICTGDGQCCNGVPCTAGRCRLP